MKANEAPEKIYILPHKDYSDRRIMNAFTENEDSKDIEYIRTDVFIDKALTYLRDKLYFDNVFYGIVSTDFNSMEEMYENFKNFMKRK